MLRISKMRKIRCHVYITFIYYFGDWLWLLTDSFFSQIAPLDVFESVAIAWFNYLASMNFDIILQTCEMNQIIKLLHDLDCLVLYSFQIVEQTLILYLSFKYQNKYTVAHVHIAYSELQGMLQNMSSVLSLNFEATDKSDKPADRPADKPADKVSEPIVLQVRNKVESMLRHVEAERQRETNADAQEDQSSGSSENDKKEKDVAESESVALQFADGDGEVNEPMSDQSLHQADVADWKRYLMVWNSCWLCILPDIK